MLKRLRQSIVVPVAAWLLLAAGLSASAEMAIDSVHVHASVATAVAGHGAWGGSPDDAALDGPDGWHLPGGSGCSGGEAADCAHCQHAAATLVHPSLPATGADPDKDLPAAVPTTAAAIAPAAPPHRPPIA